MEKTIIYFIVLLIPVIFAGWACECGDPEYNDPNAPVIHRPLSCLPTNFDFIVVGSGAGGSVVASRLAQNFTSKNILVVEGGTDGQRLIGGKDFVATKTKLNYNGVLVRDPIPWTRYDVWVYSTSIYTGDFFLNNTWGISNFPAAWHQHKVLGGNSVCNGMSWFFPTKKSYDFWNVTGWSGKDVWPFYLALENTTGLPEADETNTKGPIKISGPSYTPMLTAKFNSVIQANNFTFRGDMNEGVNHARSYYMNVYSLRNNIRDSPSVAMLAPTIKSQNNLFLATGCTVTFILFDNANNAEGVECVDVFGKTWRFYASTEVILSAGNLQNAKILFNSGIGPNSILTAFNKPKRVINERIGQKVMNQQSYTMMYTDQTIPNPNFYELPVASIEFAAYQEGIFGPPNATTAQFHVLRSNPVPDVSAFFSQAASTPGQSLYNPPFGVLLQLTYQVYMNGTLNLTSTDPLANTTWQTNSFVNPQDVDTMVAGIKAFRKVMELWPTAVEIFPGPNVTSNADLAASVRQFGGIVGHFSGSVPLGETPEYPVDLRLRVKGVQKLRMADSSVLHSQISRGMQATSAMIGQRASHFIIEEYS